MDITIYFSTKFFDKKPVVLGVGLGGGGGVAAQTLGSHEPSGCGAGRPPGCCDRKDGNIDRRPTHSSPAFNRYEWFSVSFCVIILSLEATRYVKKEREIC